MAPLGPMAGEPPLVGHDQLSIDQVRRHLATERLGFQTYLFWEVASTNATLRQLAEAGGTAGTVVLAEMQSAGRGRLGKPWFSPPGVNVHASVLFRPPIPPSAVPTFSFVASLALTEAVWAEGLAAAIKWPNDLMVAGRKAGGTLVSYALAGDVLEYVVLGVGVNVNVDREALDRALGAESPLATSLREQRGRPVDRNRFVATFLNLLEPWADRYLRLGSAAVLEAWRERDALAGRPVLVRVPGEAPFDAQAVGVDRAGHLVLDVPGNGRRAVATAEIVVRQ